jgi:hypothetical protein
MYLCKNVQQSSGLNQIRQSLQRSINTSGNVQMQAHDADKHRGSANGFRVFEPFKKSPYAAQAKKVECISMSAQHMQSK